MMKHFIAVLLVVCAASLVSAHVMNINDTSVTETDAGIVNCVFTVSLTTPGSIDDTVNFNTAAVDATTNVDFTGTLGSLTFPQGTLTQTISIQVLPDNIPEINETFKVILTNTTATPGDMEGICTIIDDDTDAPSLRVQNRLIQEGSSGGTVNHNMTVGLTAASNNNITFDYAVLAGTAGGGDVNLATGSSGITAGQTSVDIPVGIVEDTAGEQNEVFYLQISNASAPIQVPQAMGIIVDDDGGALFADLFEDGNLAGDWTYTKGPWVESGGVLTGTNLRRATAVATPVFAGCTQCSVSTTLNLQTPGMKVWMLMWYVDKKNGIQLLLKESKDLWQFKQIQNGQVQSLQKFTLPIVPNTNYQVFVMYDGLNYLLFIDGVQVMSTPAVFAPSQASFGMAVRAGTASFGEIIVN